MINTRIYDRAPLKDVRVKEPQVGRVRTPQILMSRTNEGYQKGDILDANTTAILIKNLHSPDIERLQEQIEEARRKLADAVMKDSVGAPGGVASLDSTGNVPVDQLSNIDTGLFIVVSELPTEDIKEGKIYCIKDTSSTAQDNGYIEYAYINNKWEKIGQFQAEPDLSDYAKFDDDVRFREIDADRCYFGDVQVNTIYADNADNNQVFGTNGNLMYIGAEESFVFTLEDGSTVTKSIRVLNTTTSQAEA